MVWQNDALHKEAKAETLLTLLAGGNYIRSSSTGAQKAVANMTTLLR